MMKALPSGESKEEYIKRIYNYRHSIERRISENLFRMLASRWRIYHKVMLLEPTAAESVILAALASHKNFMTGSTKNITGLCDTENVNRELTLGLWRNDNCADSMFSLEKPTRGHSASIAAKEIRDTYAENFMNEGAVQWQWDKR